NLVVTRNELADANESFRTGVEHVAGEHDRPSGGRTHRALLLVLDDLPGRDAVRRHVADLEVVRLRVGRDEAVEAAVAAVLIARGVDVADVCADGGHPSLVDTAVVR